MREVAKRRSYEGQTGKLRVEFKAKLCKGRGVNVKEDLEVKTKKDCCSREEFKRGKSSTYENTAALLAGGSKGRKVNPWRAADASWRFQK